MPVTGAAANRVYLGAVRNRIAAAGTAGAAVQVDGVNAQVLDAGSQNLFPGLHQVNVCPASCGQRQVEVPLTAGGVAANTVQVVIQ